MQKIIETEPKFNIIFIDGIQDIFQISLIYSQYFSHTKN